MTTDELYAGIDYQPLTLGIGHRPAALRHRRRARQPSTSRYQDIVVLDEVPNDISVVQGIITEEFQTPLSHVNVLSREPQDAEHGPARRDDQRDPARARGQAGRAHRRRAERWSIREVTQAEAEAFWAAHKPARPWCCRRSTSR